MVEARNLPIAAGQELIRNKTIHWQDLAFQQSVKICGLKFPLQK
jgi:hypothetical protein